MTCILSFWLLAIFCLWAIPVPGFHHHFPRRATRRERVKELSTKGRTRKRSSTEVSQSRLASSELAGFADSASACLSGGHPDVWLFAVSGAVSGASRSVARFLSYPLDTLKTKAQAESLDKEERERQRLVAKSSPRGILDLFRGVILAIVSAVPANSIFIVVFNTLDWYTPCLPPTSPFANLSPTVLHVLISAVATVPQNAFKIPAELLKQRAQLSDSTSLSFSGVIDDARRLGIFGLYQGGGAMMMREIPFNAIQMATFFWLRDSALVTTLWDDPAVQSGLLGLVAAGVAALATQPADTIKTRLMLVDGKGQSITGMAREILRTTGWRGLYVGLQSRLLLVSVGGLIYFASMQLTGGVSGSG